MIPFDWFWAPYELGWDQMWGMAGNPFCHLSSVHRQMARILIREGGLSGAMVFKNMCVCEYIHICMVVTGKRRRCGPPVWEIALISQNVSRCTHVDAKQTNTIVILVSDSRRQETKKSVSRSASAKDVAINYCQLSSFTLALNYWPNSKCAQHEHQTLVNSNHGLGGYLYWNLNAFTLNYIWSKSLQKMMRNTIISEISHEQVPRKSSVNWHWLKIERERERPPFPFLNSPQFAILNNSQQFSQFPILESEQFSPICDSRRRK